MKTFSRLLIVTLCFWLVAQGDTAASKPNVSVFLAGDMGWVDCSAYGSKYYETPCMDRIATRAMRFTDAYAQPLCSPIRVYKGTGTGQTPFAAGTGAITASAKAGMAGASSTARTVRTTPVRNNSPTARSCCANGSRRIGSLHGFARSDRYASPAILT